MTFTAEQLAEVERRVEDEYRRDREALERMKRFVNGHPDLKKGNVLLAIDSDDDSSNVDDQPTTIIGKVETVFAANPERKWTVPAMLHHLQHENFPLAANKPASTLGLVFAKLRKRGKIKMVKRGSGRTPNVFRAVPQEGDSEVNSKSERPTQGQAAALQ